MAKPKTPKIGPKTLTIDRSKWYRGKKFSALMKPSGPFKGSMCCLGFFSLACGLKPKDIKGHPYPSSMDDNSRGKVPMLLKDTYDNATSLRLASINDSRSLTDVVREKEIKSVFAKELGVKVKFIN